MALTDKNVYLGLGGNIGDSAATLSHSFARIASIPQVKELEVSSFYETTPVSDLAQPNFLNAVCRLKTSLGARQLLEYLQAIEELQGKAAKPKNVPRVIDIDILFFGTERHQAPDLEIPHPRWHERLFVIIPLMDLTTTIAVQGKAGELEIIDLLKLKESVGNAQFQRVLRIDRPKSINGF